MKTTIVLLIGLSLMHGQEIGTGLTFLKLGVGARSVAMGEAFTSITDNNPSSYYNPAASRFSDRNDISLMHKEWIVGSTIDYLGSTLPGQTFNYTLSALTTSIPGIEVRNQPGPAEGTFSAKNFSFGFGMSFFVSDDFAVGANGKFLYEKIFTDEADGYGLDLGALYKVLPDLSAGISLLNIGSMTKLKDEASLLPTTFRAGVSYYRPVSEVFNCTGALDIVKTHKDSRAHVYGGGEIVYDSFLALRAGYQTGYDVKSFSGGFGIRYGVVVFDYAFVPFTGAFSTTHTFSISFLL